MRDTPCVVVRFFAFRAEAGRSLPAGKIRFIRALTSKGAQLVEMRKQLLTKVRAQQKLGTAVLFEDGDNELKQRIDSLVKDLEDKISRTIGSDGDLSEMATVLRSIPGIGPVADTMLIAEMPGTGTISGEGSPPLSGLAPVVHDSGTLRGKRGRSPERATPCGTRCSRRHWSRRITTHA